MRSLLLTSLIVAGWAGTWSALAADFPTIYNSERDTNAQPPTAAESLAKLKLPPGFRATVFAAEPAVRNPISMAWDARGRLWVAENYTYAEHATKFDMRLRDRILFFEDKDGDGQSDGRHVFTEEVQRLTSVEVGLGGVWAMCPPQLLFFPDRDGDGTPDGAAEVVLDGFKVPSENYHNFANGLRWGPDGWLYGRCGASAPGRIGLPGTAESERLPLHGGIWRYHPTRRVVEVLTSGTMNPWGHDWNEFGETFFINTVSGHLWHMIPGAHFQVAHTQDPNPRAYELIGMHADHWHFDTAKGWQASRNGKANDLGGGHAHIGAMVYLGDNWPAEYRGHLFTLNLFGRRLNQEVLERSGSGYAARHGEDCCFFDDDWFRGLEVGYGPDGGVFVLDWNDTGECHESSGVYRTSGRVYKISYGQPKSAGAVDLAKLSVPELVALQTIRNEWFARQGRLELARRSAKETASARGALRELCERNADPVIQLRALWTLYAIDETDESFLLTQLRQSNEHLRVWAIRLLSDAWPIDTVLSTRRDDTAHPPSERVLKEFSRLAREDSSGLVRLALASTLQRLPVKRRPELAAPLLAHAEDAQDHNLPLLLWYGLIPVGDGVPDALAKLALGCEIPLTRKLIARRLAEDVERNPKPLGELISRTTKKPAAFQSDIVSGLTEALRGWRKAPKPAGWDALQLQLAKSDNSLLRDRARELALVFGDGRALDELKNIALNDKAELADRRAALQTLIESQPADLREICERLLNVRFLNTTAVRGLALFDDPAIGEKLADSYTRFHATEREAVIQTLASRPAFAKPMLEEMAAGRIPKAALTPYYARQIRSFNEPLLTQRLGEVWGELRDSPAEKEKFKAQLKSRLSPPVLAAADKSAGRVVFNNLCAPCHTLYGHGGQIGPDLTGSGRDNLDYLLENIVDPSAVVSADFRVSVIDMKDGRTLTGLITAKTDRVITLKTQAETLALNRDDVEKVQGSSLSLMPEGMLESLNETEVRDLIAYLMNRTQVP